MNPSASAQLFEKAQEFYLRYFQEKQLSGVEKRLEQVKAEIEQTGTYTHQIRELEYGARVAWRNSNRCIGRLFWKSLKIRDMRHLDTAKKVFDALIEHLDSAANGGKIKSYITIFAPRNPDAEHPVRIWNSKLIHYAGYVRADGSCLGDPSEIEFTRICQSLGWRGEGTAFDVLPVVIQIGNASPEYFELPRTSILEVAIRHPGFPWFAELGIRWYALPVISDMALEIGGILYPCAPFNGWYMLSEIACRNLADEQRYNLLPVIASYLGIDTTQKDNLWKDHCLLELNRAVLHSFRENGITIVDHHTASGQFLQFCALEAAAGRPVQADWAWIVPPMGASTLGVFHRDWPNEIVKPAFFYQDPPYRSTPRKQSVCPFHADNA